MLLRQADRIKRTYQNKQIGLAEGLNWVWQYDQPGRLVSVRRFGVDGTPAAGQQFAYWFDGIGNRTETGDRGSAESVYTVNFSNPYTERTVAGAIDVFGRADPQAVVQVNGATASRYGSYFHKVVSVDNAASAQYPEITIQADNNSAARHAFVPKNPEVFEYDDDGNLTQDGRWVYIWNGENRLIRMVTRHGMPGPRLLLAFGYDWMGRRIRKIVIDLDTGQRLSNLAFLYDGWNLIAEVNAQTGELIRTYVWGLDLSGSFQGAGGIGGLLWVNVENGSHAGRCFAAYDGNGNVMGLVSADDGSLVAQYEYGPFAEPLRATGPFVADNPIRFSTKHTDTETGLLYYGYRYYSPSLGRWLSRDPVEEALNLYLAFQNRSTKQIDYLGLMGVEKVADLLSKIQEGMYRYYCCPKVFNYLAKYNAELLCDFKELLSVARSILSNISRWKIELEPISKLNKCLRGHSDAITYT